MLTSYTNKHIGAFYSFPSKHLESMQPLDVLYIATYMNKIKKNTLEDVLQAPHYTTTIKKWKSSLGNTTVDIENHENVEEISKKLKLNIQLFYPRTNAIIGGSNHHKQSFRRAQLLKVKKNVYKPIVYGGDKGFGTFGLFQSKKNSKDESISIDLINDETYTIKDWNALLKEPFSNVPNDTFLVYQKNQANLKTDIQDQCTAILETDRVKKLTDLPIDGIDYAPIGFTTIENEQKYIGQYAYYINTNGQKVCFNLSVIDKLPKDSGVYKCPYTKNNLFAFKDVLIRFRKQLRGTKLLSKVDDYLKNIYNWDSTLLSIDLEKDGNGRYKVYTLDDINRNFVLLRKEKELKLVVRYNDTEEYMEDINMNPILEKIFLLNNIIELDASSVYLELLPPGIENLSSLKKLTLIETSLRELPPEIGQLQSLQILDLRLNELKAIPFEIGQLENLEELYLGENKITTKLPNTIGNLQNLKSFKINDQQQRFANPRDVDLLPDTIGQLSALTYLDVSEAYITRLPDTIGNLQNIRELNISGNPLTELPESLINIITSNNLVSINVTYLELEDIPTTLKDPFSKLMTKVGVVFEADHEFKELLMEDDE